MNLTVVSFLVLASGLVSAAPSLPVTKSPVTPYAGFTGPVTVDSNAIMGQWFMDVADSNVTYRTHEFYDNPTADGGGLMGHLAVSGRVASITYSPNPPFNLIAALEVEATVWNDAPASTNWPTGTNIQGEALSTIQQYTNTLRQVVLTADFAAAGVPPDSMMGTPPFRDVPSYITSTNHDFSAWYSEAEGTGYYVPGWSFGDIPQGQSYTRTFHFVIRDFQGSDTTMDSSDPRHSVLVDSHLNGTDIFINRSLSLKISEWISDPAPDVADGNATNSNVSVFHNTDEDVNQGLSVTSMKYQDSAFTLYSRGSTNGINKQILQTCTNLITTNWTDVVTNTAAWPLPQTNSWTHSNATETVRFYRIVQP
jgi:hypothetical protein